MILGGLNLGDNVEISDINIDLQKIRNDLSTLYGIVRAIHRGWSWNAYLVQLSIYLQTVAYS